MRRIVTVASLALALASSAGVASAAKFSFSTGNDMELDGDRVILTPSDGPVAEISSLGDLRIGGRLIALQSRDRFLLAQYNADMHGIVHRAVEIGVQGAGVGVRAIAEALAALVTGDHKGAEHRVEAKAATLKHEARELCRDVNKLRRLQDKIAEDVEEFRPYALVDKDRTAHCEVED